ncbi:L-lysine 6-transaminase [Candidatus Parvarchaeota archaeon]|nr:L-lysine 6-transaminase [Candidatus Parvarchaeota archaeon]
MVSPDKVHEIIGKRMLIDVYDMVLDLEKSKGLRLYDSRHDRQFLDFFGFFSTSLLGMNHPKLQDPVFLKKLQLAALNNPTNSDVYTTEMAEFVESLSKLATPRHLYYYFFIDSGTLAVENALKTAFDWKVKKNLNSGLKTERGQKVISLDESFHGRSGYSLSITNSHDIRKTQHFPLFRWPKITNPKIRFPITPENLEKVRQLEEKSLAEVKKALEDNTNDIAALIIEPIQAEGGDNHFRKEYLQELRKITRENDMLFIVDEVQTGAGTTGKLWAYQHFDFEPDILVFGKKLQVCGIMVSNKIDEIRDNVFKIKSRINSTWGGHLVDMVRASKYLQIMEDDKLIDNADHIGRIFLKGLEELQNRYPDKIGNARGRGLMCAFDMKDNQTRIDFLDKLYNNGLIALKTGESGVRFRPPLVVDENEANEALSILDKTLKETG